MGISARGAAGVLSLLLAGPGGAAAAYDPAAVPEAALAEPLDLTFHDEARDRDIPVRVYLPAGTDPAPVILFSHGLGGSRVMYRYLGERWAARGYVGVFLQHPGSDDEVWRPLPRRERQAALKAAASLANFLLRVADVPEVLDQLAVCDATADHPLRGRLDLSRVGMAGHSFGASTTQAVAGESYPRAGQRFLDPRIRAALVLSPGVNTDRDQATAFGTVPVPWLLMTGTRDQSPINNTTPADRLLVFPALPPGQKYELVLDGAQHFAFTDRADGTNPAGRIRDCRPPILALSTAFWDSTLRDDADALAWLAGDAARSVLEPGDRWQVK